MGIERVDELLEKLKEERLLWNLAWKDSNELKKSAAKLLDAVGKKDVEESRKNLYTIVGALNNITSDLGYEKASSSLRDAYQDILHPPKEGGETDGK